MLIKHSKHPSGKTIIFEEASHLYSIKEQPDINFTSGTTFLHHFTPEFDRESISLKYAKKNKLNQSDVLQQWEDKAKTSRENGTAVHSFLEDMFYGKTVMFSKNEKVRSMQKIGIQLFSELNSKYSMYESEKIVADIDNKIAGMIDLICKKNDKIIIMDYKTNESIKYDNKFQIMKFPLQKLQDCNFNHYTLQMNIYQNIMISQGYFPRDAEYERYILHITPEKFNIIECPDKQQEVELMFNHFKTLSK